LYPTDAAADITRNVLLPELATLGFNQGVNLIIEDRVGDDTAMPGLARELLQTQPNTIIAFGGAATLAAHEATKTVPIVTFGPDLVQLGVAASLTRPGGNVTGVMVLGAELDAKRLDLLREVVPSAKRIAALVLRGPHGSTERAMRAVAASTGIELL